MTIYQYSDFEKFDVICRATLPHLDKLLDILGVSLTSRTNYRIGVCPIHGGDNETALNLYDESGYWRCNTHSCHKIFKSSIIGFVRGVLSHKEYNWTKQNDKIYPFYKTIDWLLRFLERDYDSIQVSEQEIEKSNFTKQVAALSNICTNGHTIERSIIRQRLEIPADYYLKRGYSRKILEKFDVGQCNNPTKFMYNRAVVPIYDQSGNFLVGTTGRSIFEKCEKCKGYHAESVGCENGKKTAKWLHQKDFKSANYLYNFWNAKSYIKRTNTAILVESPGNVWRLEEAGIYNSLAVFGTQFSNFQRYLLDSSGVLAIIYLADRDKAGESAKNVIKQSCERTYKLYFPAVSGADIGDMTIDAINKEIKPIINEIEEQFK